MRARSNGRARADALTLDPHAQNEGPTIAFNGQVYEALITRDNANKLIPGARNVMEAGRSDYLGIQAAPERKIP